MTAAHLAFAGDGFVEQQAVPVVLVDVVIRRAIETGHPKGFEAVGGQGRGGCGRVRLVAGCAPAPISTAAVAGRGEASILPRTV